MGSTIDKIRVTSKLTTKSQATIPGKIRKILGLFPGDSVVFEVNQNKKVVIRKATPIDFEFAKAVEGTLSEWSSKNDQEAYCDLYILFPMSQATPERMINVVVYNYLFGHITKFVLAEFRQIVESDLAQLVVEERNDEDLGAQISMV